MSTVTRRHMPGGPRLELVFAAFLTERNSACDDSIGRLKYNSKFFQRDLSTPLRQFLASAVELISFEPKHWLPQKCNRWIHRVLHVDRTLTRRRLENSRLGGLLTLLP